MSPEESEMEHRSEQKIDPGHSALDGTGRMKQKIDSDDQAVNQDRQAFERVRGKVYIFKDIHRESVNKFLYSKQIGK